jgi:nucleoside-diphosphate-sugar epimerase
MALVDSARVNIRQTNRDRTIFHHSRHILPVHGLAHTTHFEYESPFRMVLVTGAAGQIGSDLVSALRRVHGVDNVIVSDLRAPREASSSEFRVLDVTDADAYRALLDEILPDTVYHLAGILSAKGEQNPDLCWKVNVTGLRTVLEEARKRQYRLFWPSSIAVFGPGTPGDVAPQTTTTDPTTMYGVTKVAGELLCQYYAVKYGVDVRSIRFPGVISYSTPPGGGTTDFAVEMFFDAVKTGKYKCFVSPETRLPLLYMPDGVKSILNLMDAPSDQITVRTSYNVTAFSPSASELAAEIRKRIPNFTCTYVPDFRQGIADSWPSSVDDSRARSDWAWEEDYDLEQMVVDMLARIQSRIL